MRTRGAAASARFGRERRGRLLGIALLACLGRMSTSSFGHVYISMWRFTTRLRALGFQQKCFPKKPFPPGLVEACLSGSRRKLAARPRVLHVGASLRGARRPARARLFSSTSEKVARKKPSHSLSRSPRFGCEDDLGDFGFFETLWELAAWRPARPPTPNDSGDLHFVLSSQLRYVSSIRLGRSRVQKTRTCPCGFPEHARSSLAQTPVSPTLKHQRES